jgi:hypothetical protein
MTYLEHLELLLQFLVVPKHLTHLEHLEHLVALAALAHLDLLLEKHQLRLELLVLLEHLELLVDHLSPPEHLYYL